MTSSVRWGLVSSGLVHTLIKIYKEEEKQRLTVATFGFERHHFASHLHLNGKWNLDYTMRQIPAVSYVKTDVS